MRYTSRNTVFIFNSANSSDTTAIIALSSFEKLNTNLNQISLIGRGDIYLDKLTKKKLRLHHRSQIEKVHLEPNFPNYRNTESFRLNSSVYTCIVL